MENKKSTEVKAFGKKAGPRFFYIQYEFSY